MFAYDRLTFNTNDLLSDSDQDSDTIYTSMISPLRYVLIFVGVIRTNDRTQTGSSYPPSVTALVIYHNCIWEKPYGETIYTKKQKNILRHARTGSLKKKWEDLQG